MPSFDTSTLPSIAGTIGYGPERERGTAPGRRAEQEGLRFVDSKSKSKKARRVTETLRIYDARPGQGKFEMDTHGCIVTNLHTALDETLDNMYDPKETAIRATYYPELEAMVKRSVVDGAGRYPKYVFGLGTQKFVEQTPKFRGTNDASAGLQASYATDAHADFSEIAFDSAWKMMAKRGVPEAEAKDLDLMFVNSWKPYGRVVKDNPFAILDWTTVDAEKDVYVHLRGSPPVKGNIYNSWVTYSPNHRWVYLPDQQPHEVWLFKQGDSRVVNKVPGSMAQYGFHVSFKLPDDPGFQNRTRRSIAVRLLVGFDKPPGGRPGPGGRTDSKL